MPEQQIDINALVDRLITGFEDYVRQKETARTDYLGGLQESNQAYLSGLEGLGTQRQQAVSQYQQPHKMGTGEKVLMGASAALPLLSMAMKPGRGRDVVGGAGALAAGVQRGGIQTRQRAKEEALTLGMGGLEQEADLLGARHKLGTGYAGAEYDTQVDEYPRMLEMARTVKGLLPKPPKAEKPPFTPTQMRTEDRMQILAQANQLVMPLQIGALGGEAPMKGEQAPAEIERFTIKSIGDLVAMIYELEQGSGIKTLPGLPTRIDKHKILLDQLKQLRDQYLGGETPMMPMGGGASSEEQADFERLQRKYGTQ